MQLQLYMICDNEGREARSTTKAHAQLSCSLPQLVYFSFNCTYHFIIIRSGTTSSPAHIPLASDSAFTAIKHSKAIMSATHNNTSDTQTASGVIQNTSTHLGLVGAIVCGAIFVIFIGWAVLEATHRARAALFTNKNSSEQTESPDAAKFKSFPSTTAVSHTIGDYRGSSSTTVTLASPEMPAPAHLPRT